MPLKRRTYNVRLIKETWSYTVQEIAALYDLHKNAVLRWIKEGLQTIDDRKPYLVRGNVLKAFLCQRQLLRKQKCAADQFYCCKCRAPRRPRQGLVDGTPLTVRVIRLTGWCETCGAKMNKTQANKALPALHEVFKITTAEPRHLTEYIQTAVNSDMRPEDETAANQPAE